MYYILIKDPFVKPLSYRTSEVISDEDDWDFYPARWMTSKTLSTPKNAISIEFWGDGERCYCDFNFDSIPIFSLDFIEALQQAGVDNIQFFEIQTRHKNGRETQLKYRAVNILDRIDCVKLGEPDYIDPSLKREFVIDENKANGALLFRPVISASTVIVHQSVKEHLEAKNFKYLSFRKIASLK